MERLPSLSKPNKLPFLRKACVAGSALISLALSGCGSEMDAKTQKILECDSKTALSDTSSEEPVEDTLQIIKNLEKKIPIIHKRLLKLEDNTLSINSQEFETRSKFKVKSNDNDLILIYESYLWNDSSEDKVLIPVDGDKSSISEGAIVCIDDGKLYPNRILSDLDLAHQKSTDLE